MFMYTAVGSCQHLPAPEKKDKKGAPRHPLTSCDGSGALHWLGLFTPGSKLGQDLWGGNIKYACKHHTSTEGTTGFVVPDDPLTQPRSMWWPCWLRFMHATNAVLPIQGPAGCFHGGLAGLLLQPADACSSNLRHTNQAAMQSPNTSMRIRAPSALYFLDTVMQAACADAQSNDTHHVNTQPLHAPALLSPHNNRWGLHPPQ